MTSNDITASLAIAKVLNCYGLNGTVSEGCDLSPLTAGSAASTMPTVVSGSGISSAEIYYEMRGDAPSTSGRYEECR